MAKKLFAMAVLLAATTLNVWAAELPKYPFVHASASAYLPVVPDQGEIDFEITAYGPDAPVPRGVLETRIAEVRALLAEQGISDADVEIRDLRLTLRKQDNPDPAAAVYDMVCSVHIEVKDLKKWRAVMGPLIGIKNLNNFSTSFKTSERDRIEADLVAQAIKNAQRRAEGMARAAGRRLGPAIGVSTGELKNLTSAVGLERGAPEQQAESNRENAQGTRDLLMIVVLKMAQSADVIFSLK
jgi:uncharacterized protein YggE